MNNSGRIRLRISIVLLLYTLSQCASGSAAENDTEIVLRKCCPDNFYLNQSIFTPFYECINGDNSSVSSFAKRGLVTYRITADEDEINIPDCEIVEKVLNSQSFSSIKAGDCIDAIGSVFIVLTCAESASFSERNSASESLLKLRKCCPHLHSFNIYTKECVPDAVDNTEAQFEEILGNNSAIMTVGSPECDSKDVMVEYHSHTHTLSLEKTSLKIGALSWYKSAEILLPDTFCIERTTNVSKRANFNATHYKENPSQWIAKACRPKEVCNHIPCIRKCCKDGEYMTLNRTCGPYPYSLRPFFQRIDADTNELVQDEPREYGTSFGLNCSRYILENHETDHLSGLDGRLHIKDYSNPIDHDKYCFDFFAAKLMVFPEQPQGVVCFPELPPYYEIEHKVYAVCLVISCVLLGTTLVIYLCLPKLMNLHGKTLACHVFSLFCGYLSLAIVKFNTKETSQYCMVYAFIIYFSFLAAFSWLNVLCFDIFWTFGSMRAPRGMRKSRNFYRFIYYSIYAWGLPLVFTIFTLCAEIYQFFPEAYLPNLAQGRCWFQARTYGHYFYFIAPIAVQIVINIILFTLTAIHCNKVKSDIHRMQHSSDDKNLPKKRFQANKAKFIMNLKLFIVMGITWLLEIIATFFPEPRQIWYFWDSVNMLQGVFVFIIFVYKKKVFNAIKERLGISRKGDNRGPTALGATTTTMLTNGSTALPTEMSGRYKSTEKLESPLMKDKNRLSP